MSPPRNLTLQYSREHTLALYEVRDTGLDKVLPELQKSQGLHVQVGPAALRQSTFIFIARSSIHKPSSLLVLDARLHLLRSRNRPCYTLGMAVAKYGICHRKFLKGSQLNSRYRLAAPRLRTNRQDIPGTGFPLVDEAQPLPPSFLLN